MTISLSAFCHRCKQPVEDCGCVTPEQRRQLFADESESRINAFRTALDQSEAQIQEFEGRLNNPCDMCLESKEIINELEAKLQATKDAGMIEVSDEPLEEDHDTELCGDDYCECW